MNDRLLGGAAVFNVRLKVHFVCARIHFEQDGTGTPARKVLSQGIYIRVQCVAL